MVRFLTRQSDRFGTVELGSRRNAGDHERQTPWKALLLRSVYGMLRFMGRSAAGG